MLYVVMKGRDPMLQVGMKAVQAPLLDKPKCFNCLPRGRAAWVASCGTALAATGREDRRGLLL